MKLTIVLIWLGLAALSVSTSARPVTLPGAPVGASLTTPALLDSLQHTAFLYFWQEVSPISGLIKDRSTSWSPCSIAAQGFGISAICIAIDHGWVTREVGRARILLGLETLWNGAQGPEPSNRNGYKGLFYHFLDLNTGVRVWDSELSTIDTALLMAGVLDARQYFDTADPVDAELRDLCDALYHRVDWEFMRDGSYGIRMGWKPVTGFSGYGKWYGYNEAMILYILALGSPTHPVPAIDWTYWTSGYSWSSHYGYEFVTCPPLFTHQYSHCWIDFRGIQDPWMSQRGIDYFENSRRATLANRAYCIANPGGWSGYGAEYWGLTASDDPNGYAAHGAPPAQSDNGTISPTAAAGSIVFAPDEVIPTLHAMYDNLGTALWGEYGFKDAFNLTLFWWAPDYLGIDQGPFILMIENYLNEGVWQRFNDNPDIVRGLQRAGFVTATSLTPFETATVEAWTSPNPFTGSTTVSYRLGRAGPVTLDLYDARGRLVRSYEDQAGDRDVGTIVVNGSDLASGLYFYRLNSDSGTVWKRCVLVK